MAGKLVSTPVNCGEIAMIDTRILSICHLLSTLAE